MLSYRHINKCAAEAGFTLCGIARARVLEAEAERYGAALAASGDAAPEYLTREPHRRLDPQYVLAGARTVVVCALDYENTPGTRPEGKVSAHRREGDYHEGMKARLNEVIGRLKEAEPGLRGRAVCDTAPILEKAWAVEAGLGWIGRNSLLVTPSHGPFVLLGEIVTDAECDEYDEPYRGGGCGKCRRCVENCPTGALVEGVPGDTAGGVAAVDAGRCISALTIEKSRRGEATKPLHGWITGCDECMTVCPKGRAKGRK